MALPRADKADICLLLEGTFPYVSGGVSSWVNQIIRGFPEYTFACCFVGSRPEDYGEMKYTLPDNVCIWKSIICMTSSVGHRRNRKRVTWRHTIGCAVFMS